jgi:hypothetical protein
MQYRKVTILVTDIKSDPNHDYTYSFSVGGQVIKQTDKTQAVICEASILYEMPQEVTCIIS